MHKFILLIALWSWMPPLALAADPLPLPVGELAYRSNDDPDGSSYKRPAEIKTQVRKAWKLQMDSTIPVFFDQANSCSAVFVGPNGEALTNLHCLENCLIKKDAVISDGRKRSLRKDTQVFCEAQFGKPLKAGVASILKVFGPGWLADRETLYQFAQENPDEYFSLLNQGFESYGDLVLVKFSTPTQNSCVRLSGETLDVREKVLSLSYPKIARATNNPVDPLIAFGITQMWSHGEIAAGKEDITQVISQIELLKNYGESLALQGITLSTLDAETGASGSPAFNLKGEVASILRSTFKPVGAGYIPWTSQGIEIAPIKKDVEALVPNYQQCGI